MRLSLIELSLRLPHRAAALGHAGRHALVFAALALPLSAQIVVVPLNYTATAGQGQAQGGSFNYFDDTGRQLIDGTFGVNDWTANLGQGNAYEWVGWVTVDPTIVFNFSTPVAITAVTIGFSRHWASGIFLPGTVTIGSESFSLTGTELNDFTRADLTFNLAQPVFSNQLTLSLSDGNGNRWIFLDEVQFTAVPEPPVTWLLVMGCVAIFARVRKRAAPPA